MPMSVTKKSKKNIDPEAFSDSIPVRNNPPMPKGKGGMNVSGKVRGIDPEAIGDNVAKRDNPPKPKK